VRCQPHFFPPISPALNPLTLTVNPLTLTLNPSPLSFVIPGSTNSWQVRSPPHFHSPPILFPRFSCSNSSVCFSFPNSFFYSSQFFCFIRFRAASRARARAPCCRARFSGASHCPPSHCPPPHSPARFFARVSSCISPCPPPPTYPSCTTPPTASTNIINLTHCSAQTSSISRIFSTNLINLTPFSAATLSTSRLFQRQPHHPDAFFSRERRCAAGAESSARVL